METAAWIVLWGLVPTLSSALSSLQTNNKRDNPVNKGRRATGEPSPSPVVGPAVQKHKVFGVERAVDIPENVFLSEEERRQMEQAMPWHEHCWFPSSFNSDHQLHYRKWMPSTNNATSRKPKAVVIFMHGIQTHSGKANILSNGRKINVGLQAEMLLNENCALFAFDMYGHGFSEGMRFWIPSWENNKQDYINFVHLVQKQVGDTVPIFLLGESYGSTLTLHVAKHFQDHPSEAPKRFNSIILTAPAIIGDVPPRPIYDFFMFLARRYPQWRPFFMVNPVSPDRIWRDPEVLKIRSDPKFIASKIDGSGEPFILGTAANMVWSMDSLRQEVIPAFQLPFMILHGTKDYAVPIAGSEFMWENVATPMEQRKFLRKEGVYHDIFSDQLAEECMQDVIDWINDRLSK